MRFSIIGTCMLTLDHVQGDKRSKHVATNIRLDTEGCMLSPYEKEPGVPNSAGCQALTLAFVSGLSANIHHAHEMGYRDSAEHLRYIIGELEKQFIGVPSFKRGNMVVPAVDGKAEFKIKQSEGEDSEEHH